MKWRSTLIAASTAAMVEAAPIRQTTRRRD